MSFKVKHTQEMKIGRRSADDAGAGISWFE